MFKTNPRVNNLGRLPPMRAAKKVVYGRYYDMLYRSRETNVRDEGEGRRTLGKNVTVGASQFGLA